ncbi:hypothetical protein HYDPIDRAFT_77784 [Hydnomerulius pinastri MD-312]|nr:hypothetical protein HYDPIDRAFT_77784 [Hydnomerulius pinastri MD-312]
MAVATPPPGYPTPFPQPPTVPGYPALYALPPVKAPSPPPEPPAAPDIPAISPGIASKEVQKLIVHQLKRSEFDSIEPPALQRLELEVVAFIQNLYERAHEYANLASRAVPIAKDALLACDEQGLAGKDLHAIAVASQSTGEHGGSECNCVMTPSQDVSMESLFEPPPPRERSPELLPSDDEGAPPVIPTTLRSLPSYLPPLPPKHTYLKTPASPPKKAALPSLERKLKTAGLVQESLKNLLTATEDNLGQEDGELLGHIVNWEVSAHPRKRWKVSA